VARDAAEIDYVCVPLSGRSDRGAVRSDPGSRAVRRVFEFETSPLETSLPWGASLTRQRAIVDYAVAAFTAGQ
jgi:hypothetical protein